MTLLHLLCQIGAILLLGRALGRAFRWVGQPRVMAEIIAGVLLGPSLLGMVAPEAYGLLFPPESLIHIGTTSQLGLVLFMFLVGLDFDPSLLKGHERAAVGMASAGIVIPFTLGGLLSLGLYPSLAPDGVGRLPFGLFVGVAMSVTAFPVLARILAERRLIRTPLGALALAVAAVGDVTAWCLLAAVVAVATSAGGWAVAQTLAWTAAYVVGMWTLVRPVLARIGPRGGHNVSRDVVAMIFLLLLGSSILTEWIGIHALFGAFLFGAVVPRERGLAGVLVEKTEDLVTLILLPLFFASSGLRTQLGLLASWSDVGWTAAIVVVATAGKWGGTWWAARRVGLDGRVASALGVLMNTRGLMELVVLNVGLDLGVISPRLFSMMVVMALTTTLATSPWLERLYPAAERLKQAAAPTDGSGLLVALSDPGIARAMVSLAEAWTRRSRAPVWALHLLPVQRTSESLSGTVHGDGEVGSEALDEVVRAAHRQGLALHPVALPSADPEGDLVRLVGHHPVDLLVIGGHRSAVSDGRTLAGLAGGVLRRSPVDVGVLLDRGLGPVRRIGQIGDDPAVVRVVSRLVHEGRVKLIPGAREGVDLVIASPSAQAEIPEVGGPSWLIVGGGTAPRPAADPASALPSAQAPG